jgi:1-acyl-sn-glycerol-3-phosphate acyltransferase
MRLMARLILQLFGWNPDPVGSFPIEPRKCVIIVAPHTSNWDFVWGVLYRIALEMENVRFLGKKELFTPLYGWFFRWLGGTPVDRHSSRQMVDQVAEWFGRKEEFRLALSPEGTRKKVERLRTGFYHIARKAGVPIVMVALDFEQKQVVVSPPFYPSDNPDQDMEHVLRFFRPIKGKYPEKGLGHL